MARLNEQCGFEKFRVPQAPQVQPGHVEAALAALHQLRSELGALKIMGQPLIRLFSPQLRTLESALKHVEGM